MKLTINLLFILLFTSTSFALEVTETKGFFNYKLDEAKGFISLNVKNLNQEFLYVNSLSAGVGSNDIGLDRGQLGNTRVVKFIKAGDKLLLIQPNYNYRAVSNNKEEVKSVEEAFAQSVLWGFTYVSDGEGGYIIEISDFLLRDAHGVAERLSSQKEGKYGVDKSRSALYLPRIKNFPDNTEFESIITFKGVSSGANIRSVTPSPQAVTVRMHHSFVRLPDNQYEKRDFDPRSGFGFISYQDYATPIDEPLVKRFIRRHRLKKKNPKSAVSEAVEPIIYYVDRGAPEPVRSALIEGASWWNQAFEAAGYRNAFQVKVLPEGADPLDVRYNVIQWVHRSTRGWSYGASVTDPRTGEIIKGHVSLGSLRVRQDFLIAEGLLNPYQSGGDEKPLLKMSLARLRQLSAHEVGHTIGLAHNFAASYNDRASVMDYPHPQIDLDANGNISLANAYAVGIGDWDKATIKYGYAEDTKQARTNELNKAFKSGLKYITDQDARPRGSAHPYAHLWENGKNPADELNQIMKIRKTILGKFSEASIKTGAPYATIEEALAPMYFIHRFQIEGAAKMVGGLNYSYAIKGADDLVTEWVKATDQKNAIDALVGTLNADHLALPEKLLKIIPPRAFGYGRTRETFKSKTGVTFDALTPAQTAADMTLSLLFHPERANRLLEYNSRNSDLPSLSEVINKVLAKTIYQPSKNGYIGEIGRIVNVQVIRNILSLGASQNIHPQVKAITDLKISQIKSKLLDTKNSNKSEAEMAHSSYLLSLISKYEKNVSSFRNTKALSPPDGSPIGSGHDVICTFDKYYR